MPAVVIAIADAVAAVLNAAELNQPFTAVRRYVPVRDLKDLATLAVTVVPATLAGTLLDRAGHNLYTYTIDVGIQKSIGSGEMTSDQINNACDPLMLFAEQAADLFDGKSLAGYPQARCIDVKNVPIFAPNHLDEMRVFTSVLSLTFRLGR